MIMVRSSSALLVAVLSVVAMCMSEATYGPKVRYILVSKEFQVALGKAWKEIFLGNYLYQAKGGWVYADSNNLDKYLFVQLANPQRSAKATLATARSTKMQLDNPEKDGVPAEEGRNYKVVTDFHTHPFPGQRQRPDSDGVRKAYERGVSGIVVSCSGVFYYAPQSRDPLDSPTGYPRASSEQYKGWKEVRFSDTSVDSEGRCKP